MELIWRVLLVAFFLQIRIRHSHAGDNNRIRIYLKDNERLVVPKNSKVSILKPVVVSYNDKVHVNPLVPIYLPKRTIESYNANALSDFYYLNNAFALPPYHVQAANAVRNSGGNEWYGGGGGGGGGAYRVGGAVGAEVKAPVADVKPVHEHIEDDIKYDFRTKTHSIRR